MYRGKGAGRWAESSSGARVLPYRPHACACTAARRDMPDGTRSLPCWPCVAAAAATVWTRMAAAPRAHPPLGKRRWPPRLRRSPIVGGGGRAKHVRYRPGGLWLRPPSNPRGGGSSPRLLRAAEMRLKTSGSNGGRRSAGGGGGGGVPLRRRRPRGPRAGGGA